jgi:hypothetical protein
MAQGLLHAALTGELKRLPRIPVTKRGFDFP